MTAASTNDDLCEVISSMSQSILNLADNADCCRPVALIWDAHYERCFPIELVICPLFYLQVFDLKYTLDMCFYFYSQ